MKQAKLPLDRQDGPELDELLSELERAVDVGFLYDMECALSVAAAAREPVETLQT